MGESLSDPDGGGAPCGRLTCRAPDAPEREDAADEGPRRLPVKARRGGRRVLKPSATRRRLFPISRPARCLVGGCAQGFSNAERPHRVPSVSDSYVGGHGTASGAACQRSVGRVREKAPGSSASLFRVVEENRRMRRKNERLKRGRSSCPARGLGRSPGCAPSCLRLAISPPLASPAAPLGKWTSGRGANDA